MQHLPHVVPAPAGEKVLHIGLPKTGTTALQTALHRSRPALLAQGVFNAASGRHPWSAARFAAGHPLAYRPQAEQGWKRLAARFRESTARVTVLSSEAFVAASPERARAIVEELGGRVQVVVTIRALAPQLRSHWQQSFIRSGELTFDAWMNARLDDEERLHRKSPAAVLDAWARVVGEDRVLFMVAEPGDRTLLFRRFEELLGLTPGSLEVPRVDNAALSASGSEFLRQLNLLDTTKRDDPTSVRAEILRRGTRRVQHLPGLQRDPVRIPRWAATRANDVARTWIDQLEVSSARVVGRLEDLLVDVEDLPEDVVTPSEVDVVDAARFALEFCGAAIRYYEHDRPRPPQVPRSLDDVSGRELLAALRAKVARRVLRRGSGRQPVQH